MINALSSYFNQNNNKCVLNDNTLNNIRTFKETYKAKWKYLYMFNSVRAWASYVGYSNKELFERVVLFCVTGSYTNILCFNNETWISNSKNRTIQKLRHTMRS